jgi:hypothetical protein
MTSLVLCETPAAIARHIRVLGPREAPNYHGRVGAPKTLCGAAVGWDLKMDLEFLSCRSCIRRVVTAAASGTALK